MIGYLRKIIFFLILVALWEGVYRLHIWPPDRVPSFLDVLISLIDGFSEKNFLLAIGHSLERVFKGYFLSLLLGIPLGLLIGRIKILEDTIGSLMLGMQTLPSICWLPLAILWFGLSEKAIIVIVLLGAIFSISLATESGVKNVLPIFIRAAQNMGATGWKIYVKVIIPAAMPSIITGMKIGWSFAWRALMAGELLSPGGIGLGQILMMGRDLADMTQVIAVMIIIASLGLIIDRLLFTNLERKVRQKWGLEIG